MMGKQGRQSPARLLTCSHRGVYTSPEVTSSGIGLLWPKLSHPFWGFGHLPAATTLCTCTHTSALTLKPHEGLTEQGSQQWCLGRPLSGAKSPRALQGAGGHGRSPTGQQSDTHSLRSKSFPRRVCLIYKDTKNSRTAWSYSHNLVVHRNAPPKM